MGDLPAAVAENRRRLASIAQLPPPEQWHWLHQVHGAEVQIMVALAANRDTRLADARRSGAPARHRFEVPTADAAVTDQIGLPLVVLTADCASIALATDDAVGVVHAGWRGLVDGVVAAAVSSLRGIGRGPVRAVLGPCIHPAAYEFAPEDLARISATLGPQVVAATADGRPAFDLPAGVRGALEAAGVESIEDLDLCTAQSDDYFSYRRDGVTGRQALVVVREA